MQIIPAILPKNYIDLKHKLGLIRGLVGVVQIDICDGVFVGSTTWPFDGGEYDEHFKNILNEEEGIPYWEEVDFELDLMVADAVDNFDIYLKLGPRRVVLHLEAADDYAEFKGFLEGIDNFVRDVTEIGVAFNPSTDISNIYPLLNNIDFVQFMGIDEIGLQGQEFNNSVVEKIKSFKSEYPDVIVSVDG
ncbi:MAG: hypothetical protein ACKOW9_05585, partial [Candidatus Paceibacterota bacterium]